MSISLEFIDFVIPISVIEEKYRGGWIKCLSDHKSLIGGTVWFDDHLFRDGAMNSSDIDLLVDCWTKRGFEPFEQINGVKVWKDFCILDGGEPTLPCDWIQINENEYSASLKDTPPSQIVDRSIIRSLKIRHPKFPFIYHWYRKFSQTVGKYSDHSN